MIRRIQSLNERSVLIMLVVVAATSLAMSFISHWLDGSGAWWGWADSAFQNFSTEMIGALVTFVLFEAILGTRKAQQAKEEANAQREAELETNRKQLQVNAITRLKLAKNLHELQLILDEMNDNKLLRNANLSNINLEKTRLQGFDLRGAELSNAKLTDADLSFAHLEKAWLSGANLQGSDISYTNMKDATLHEVNLHSVKGIEKTYFNEATVLPNAIVNSSEMICIYRYPFLDGGCWTPETDMSRFTNPTHPDFWQPRWLRIKKS